MVYGSGQGKNWIYTLKLVARMYLKQADWTTQQLEINILPSIWQFFLPDAKLDLVENETLKRTQLILLVLLAS